MEQSASIKLKSTESDYRLGARAGVYQSVITLLNIYATPSGLSIGDQLGLL